MKTVTTPLAGCDEMRDLLQAELGRRCDVNSSYSLRAFARDLGTDHSTLSQVLRRRRTLTEPMIREFGLRLGLPSQRIEFLIERERLRDGDAGEIVDPVSLGDQQEALTADGLHFAILE